MHQVWEADNTDTGLLYIFTQRNVVLGNLFIWF